MLILVLLTLSGCAAKYGPYGSSNLGGYSETRVGQDTYSIKFELNAVSSKSVGYDWALLRAAEVTTENGYKYFVVMESYDRVGPSGNDDIYKVIKCYKKSLIYKVKLFMKLGL